MKKKFIEPEIKRIELNLNENIASSEPFFEEYKGIFYITHGYKGCLENTQEKGIHYDNINGDNFGSLYGCFISGPKEAAEVLGLRNVY